MPGCSLLKGSDVALAGYLFWEMGDLTLLGRDVRPYPVESDRECFGFAGHFE